MNSPEFSKQTIDTLAKRARFQCSNPDCAVQTIGPNSAPNRATIIGEAAHIFGAKPNSMRYDITMSDVTRAAITNGIWLCRNCHGQIDRDARKYTGDLLFAWRKQHEERVLNELGTRGERIRHEVEKTHLEFLKPYPQIIQRIAIDKPKAWEWRLAAELMKHLNKPEFKRLRNLRAGHYFRAYPQVKEDEFIAWVQERAYVMSRLVEPLVHLFDRLTKSFGEVGESGNAEEIHDVCVLIRDMLSEAIKHEESLVFASIPDGGEQLQRLLVNSIGKNLDKLEEIPKKFDEAVEIIGADHDSEDGENRVITLTITFDLPNDFEKNVTEAAARYLKYN